VGPRHGSWLEQRTNMMLEELDLLGLSAPPAELARMIQKTLAEVAATAGISETSARRYLDDERLRSLAQEVALELAEERPGADLRDQPRTIPVSHEVVGQVVMALAEVTRIRVLNADEAGANETLELVSFLGYVLHEAPQLAPGLHLPLAALTRAARLLEAGAQIIGAGGVVPPGLPAGNDRLLARAFLADAKTLRALVGEHGADAGPTPDS
jgi:AcrR family transcriptional regulator